MQENYPLDLFLKRLITANKKKQAAAIDSAMAILNGKPEERLIYSGADACRLLSISSTSLWRLRQAGKIKPVVVLNRPKYRRTDLERLAQGDEIAKTTPPA